MMKIFPNSSEKMPFLHCYISLQKIGSNKVQGWYRYKNKGAGTKVHKCLV